MCLPSNVYEITQFSLWALASTPLKQYLWKRIVGMNLLDILNVWVIFFLQDTITKNEFTCISMILFATIVNEKCAHIQCTNKKKRTGHATTINTRKQQLQCKWLNQHLLRYKNVTVQVQLVHWKIYLFDTTLQTNSSRDFSTTSKNVTCKITSNNLPFELNEVSFSYVRFTYLEFAGNIHVSVSAAINGNWVVNIFD